MLPACKEGQKHFWEKDENFLRRLDAVRQVLEHYIDVYGNGKEILGAGIVIDGSISNMDQRFSSYQKGNIESFLEQYFNVQIKIPVYVENMSNMSAFFEWNRLTLNRSDIHTLVCLSISYSIDCAIIFNGKFLKGKNPSVRIFAVEPDTSAVLSGGKAGPHLLQGIGAGFVPATLDTGIIDRVFPVSAEDAGNTARSAAKKEGLLIGISGGAALSVALNLSKEAEWAGRRIVVLLPDSGERYLSTWLFQTE